MQPRKTIDDLMTLPEWCEYTGREERYWRSKLDTMPGVIRESRETIFIHGRSYIEGRLGKGKR